MFGTTNKVDLKYALKERDDALQQYDDALQQRDAAHEERSKAVQERIDTKLKLDLALIDLKRVSDELEQARKTLADIRPLRCSFCGKTQHEVTKLFVGPSNISICNECVDACVTEEEKSGSEGP